jgi:hypothetical protein
MAANATEVVVLARTADAWLRPFVKWPARMEYTVGGEVGRRTGGWFDG